MKTPSSDFTAIATKYVCEIWIIKKKVKNKTILKDRELDTTQFKKKVEAKKSIKIKNVKNPKNNTNGKVQPEIIIKKSIKQLLDN